MTTIKTLLSTLALSIVYSHLALAGSTKAVMRNHSQIPAPTDDNSFYPRNENQEHLGKLLFFDKIISGNKNISCATCHHPFAATGDGLSLPVGEGGLGFGVTRDTGPDIDAIHERVPRNAPHIFNLGAREFDTMFFDGRVQVDHSQPSGFITPAGEQFPIGILSNPLAAQAMFPVTSSTEMAGQAGENSIADATANGNLNGENGVWPQLAKRLQAIPEYVELFQQAFDDINQAEDITFAHAAEAMGAFEASAWRCDNSRFDKFLRGGKHYLSREERWGMYSFYSEYEGNCASCHSGVFQSDQAFHAIAMPQIGPGKGDNQAGYQDGLDDFGREQVTGNPADRFKFRTPSLRMVAQTGPWGHDGAYDDLEQVVRHHVDTTTGLYNYNSEQAMLPFRADLNTIDFMLQSDPARLKAIADASEIKPMKLSDKKIKQIVAFLHTLTDTSCIDLRRNTPEIVPSGLPVAD